MEPDIYVHDTWLFPVILHPHTKSKFQCTTQQGHRHVQNMQPILRVPGSQACKAVDTCRSGLIVGLGIVVNRALAGKTAKNCDDGCSREVRGFADCRRQADRSHLGPLHKLIASSTPAQAKTNPIDLVGRARAHPMLSIDRKRGNAVVSIL